MYLKSFKLSNFRKFGTANNVIEFVDSNESFQKDSVNIATATTLIVGKNNSGKTTISLALEKILSSGKQFRANDFNFTYLKKLLDKYKTETFDEWPILEFEIIVGVNQSNTSDLVTNLIPFMNISNTEIKIENNYLNICIKYELEEKLIFENEVRKMISRYSDKGAILFQKFIELIDGTTFNLNYFDQNNNMVDSSKFKINELIEIKIITANKIIHDTSLSAIFNKIIKFRYDSKNTNLDSKIESINDTVTEEIQGFNQTSINNVLHSIEDSKRFQVRLSSNLTFEKLINNLIKYEYTEFDVNIPEGQFGLGYANLMSIIGQLIEYIERYPIEEKHSKLNLICIEEPEAFMHPQMQELFIKNINEAIKVLLSGAAKEINSQLFITTHSSHILNSKIHVSNSFNNINYITILNNFSTVVNLNDDFIIKETREADIKPKADKTIETIKEELDKKRQNDLKFIKKHVKNKVSEVFFSDAIIFVEGITEDTMLSYYISNNKVLNKYYITTVNINGAHGLIYHDLIKLIKIPTLVITDLDIKREQEEKKNFEQVTKLTGRTTTNKTIMEYNLSKENIENIPQYFEDENLYITFQSQGINGYIATSFEEAFILTNHNNEIVNTVLKQIKPDIYKVILVDQINRDNILHSSYKLQEKLSNNKSDFANHLLYQISINEDESLLPQLPSYIKDGLVWLEHKLEPRLEIS